MPSFRPFAQGTLVAPYNANVFWTCIVPQKFRGFDESTRLYASTELGIVNRGPPGIYANRSSSGGRHQLPPVNRPLANCRALRVVHFMRRRSTIAAAPSSPRSRGARSA